MIDMIIGVLIGHAIAWSTLLVMLCREKRKLERPPQFVGPWCAECHGPFSEWEWEMRHTRYDGEDVHADCCFATKCETARWEAA